MILDHFGDLNWLAILVAAVAWFAFSAAWYSVPPLSSAWQQAAKVNGNEGLRWQPFSCPHSSDIS